MSWPRRRHHLGWPTALHLGLEPHLLSGTLIESLFEVTKRYAHRVRPDALRPTIRWRSPASEPAADA